MHRLVRRLGNRGGWIGPDDASVGGENTCDFGRAGLPTVVRVRDNHTWLVSWRIGGNGGCNPTYVARFRHPPRDGGQLALAISSDHARGGLRNSGAAAARPQSALTGRGVY